MHICNQSGCLISGNITGGDRAGGGGLLKPDRCPETSSTPSLRRLGKARAGPRYARGEPEEDEGDDEGGSLPLAGEFAAAPQNQNIRPGREVVAKGNTVIIP